MHCRSSALCIAAALAWGAGARAEAIRVDCAFPGGNILVEKIAGDAVTLRQDRRDTKGFWFYWYFRVQNAAGRTLRFHFTDGAPVGVRGPAVSLDEGGTWRWLGKEAATTNAFTYAFPDDAGPVRFSFGMPYTQANLAAFLARFQGNPALRVTTLCRSRKDRPVDFLELGRPDAEPGTCVFITCRHHCCEMMASYALEGIVERALGDNDDGLWLRENAALGIVPLVDSDGVEDGDQGKNRHPRDHNRDYDGEGLYPETRAIRALLPGWLRGRPAMTLDLHCPSIRGRDNEHVYQVGRQGPALWARQQEFGKILEEVRAGPLPYKADGDLPFGTRWNTAQNYAAGTSFSKWSATVPGVFLATGFEIPYANASGCEVNARTARAFGHDIARALRRFLETRSLDADARTPADAGSTGP